ncbi:MAG TPA: TRAP transporter large permease [Virgibacillus sp.]|nr:TRAP transporter large permease [Virgibacillus sp.]
MGILFISFIVALLLGVPIYAAIGSSAMIALMVGGDLPVSIIPQTFFSGIDNHVLIAVAMFIIAGAIMEASGMTDDILEVADSLIGYLPGGVGISTLLASALFAALTGSGLAATVAIGSITVGGMVQRHYPRPLAGAIAATGGALGVLIPPSNPLIIYGVISGASISGLFMAGLIPGILIALSLMIVMYVVGKKNKLASGDQKFSIKRIGRALWRGKWGLIAPIIILGGIYTGYTTPTEASEVAVLYALLYGLVIKRNIGMKFLVKAFRNGAITAAVMLSMTGVASGFGRLVTLYQIPQTIGEFVTGITTDPRMVMLLLILVLMITGMFMETLSQIIILTPIFLPIVTQMGVDPIVFGIIFVLCIEIGFLTPPIGGNLFVAVKLTDSSLLKISKAEIPFILTFLAWAIIFVFFPEIIMFLPNLLK